MRRVRVLPLLFGATALVACAALLDIRDLTVADSGAADASASCDAASGTGDDCIAEGGVMILSTKGELNALFRASLGIFGSGVLYAAGWIPVGNSTSLYVQAFSYSGEAGVFYSDNQNSNTVGSAITVNAGPGTGYLYVVGNSANDVRLESFNTKDLPTPVTTHLADAAVPNAVLTQAVAVDSDGVNLHIYGRALVGSVERAFVLRINASDGGIDHATLMTGPAHANGGVSYTEPDGSPLSNEVDILADVPDAGSVLSRYNPALLFDSMFAIPFNGSARAIDTDDVKFGPGYYVVGQAPDASGFVAAHLTHDGGPDPTFGSGGVVVAPGNNRGANAFVIDATNNHLWLVGFDRGQAAVARVVLDAGLDPTFGEGGVMTFGFAGELRTVVLVGNHVVAGGVAEGDAGPNWALVWIVR